MITKYNILYLHGLEGWLSEEKRTIIEQFGNCFAPTIDYRKPKIFNELHDLFLDKNIDIIMGSSMGGYCGYLLSLCYDTPALIFNPAFPYRSVDPDITGVEIPQKKQNTTTIVLGKKDNLIKYKDNFAYIKNNFAKNEYELIEIDSLEHRIPNDIFQECVSDFFK